MKARNDAVLLLAHGSPETMADIPEFMQRITGGRVLPETVIEEVKHRYQLIGRSPLLEITLWQAQLLEHEVSLPVYVGMRNWKPFIAETVQKMAAAGVTKVTALCMAPQSSQTSVGLYHKALCAATAGTKIETEFVESWHDQPQLIRAFAEKLLPAWKQACLEIGGKVPVIFTAHSVPTRTIREGDPYEAQARSTAELVIERLPEIAEAGWKFAFQSQGMSKEAWIGPTVEQTILELARGGHRGVVIQAIGFLCDHVEVLYDIDIGCKKFAEQKGMRLWRSESLNESPYLTAALAGLVRNAHSGTQQLSRK